MSSGYKTLGALFFIWLGLMLYFAITVPHSEHDKRIEDELKSLNSNFRKLQKENQDLRNQLEEYEIEQHNKESSIDEDPMTIKPKKKDDDTPEATTSKFLRWGICIKEIF